MAPRALRLADLTWPEIAELREHAPVVVVPLGAREQHGRGLARRTTPPAPRPSPISWPSG
jgi:creatinine amidohydrolase